MRPSSVRRAGIRRRPPAIPLAYPPCRSTHSPPRLSRNASSASAHRRSWPAIFSSEMERVIESLSSGSAWTWPTAAAQRANSGLGSSHRTGLSINNAESTRWASGRRPAASEVVSGILALVGKHDVDRHRARVDRRQQLQAIGQRLAYVHAAVLRERGLVDRQDGRLRLPRLGWNSRNMAS